MWRYEGEGVLENQYYWYVQWTGLDLDESKTLLISSLFSLHNMAQNFSPGLLTHLLSSSTTSFSPWHPPPHCWCCRWSCSQLSSPLPVFTQYLLHPRQGGLQSVAPAHRHLHLGHPGKDAAAKQWWCDIVTVFGNILLMRDLRMRTSRSVERSRWQIISRGTSSSSQGQLWSSAGFVSDANHISLEGNMNLLLCTNLKGGETIQTWCWT